ncbi:ATPase WRNIP1 [Neosynchiropus ocellatus]
MATEMTASSTDLVQCPVCSKSFNSDAINNHLDICLISSDPGGGSPVVAELSGPPLKKVCAESGVTAAGAGCSSPAATSTVFSVFQTSKSKPSTVSERNGFFSNKPKGSGVKRTLEDEPRLDRQISLSDEPSLNAAARALLMMDKPLAESLRPNSLEEYFGQNKVVGEQTQIRSLLDSHDIPSLILWGPPGCGKTTLAHIIANTSKKRRTTRFATLSATNASVHDVREIIKQAQNELRLCKRRTILFIDEIHRFNKSQQDTFLPHVECGTITLIGATTENPSFQVNAALLSRCRVLVLEKLSVEAMGSILNRAVTALGIKVLPRGEGDVEGQAEGDQPSIYMEQEALDTVAYFCDGDARAGLNSLQIAVQAQVRLFQSHLSGPDGPSEARILVKEDHIKESLQRSHILYDKAGEEHYNCMSALHKSMRGSHENASLYWLGRMLEGGEDPLYVARRLVRFASEDVGTADPAALPQAVSAFQACHFIGMPECEVILAQCVVYLSRAPKSVEVYMAYSNVKACLRNHRGPLPPVPLHLRNAPTKLMKQLGYAKGYKYNPAFSAPVEQDYLPVELRGTDFFTWTPSDL